MSEYNEDAPSDNKPLSLEEYRNYKKLFEKCLTTPMEESDVDLYFGSSYEGDIDEMIEEEYNE